MADDPAATAASVLRHVARCRAKNLPVRPRRFAGALVMAEDSTGTVPVVVADPGAAWRLRVYAAANRVRVSVEVDPEALEKEE